MSTPERSTPSARLGELAERVGDINHTSAAYGAYEDPSEVDAIYGELARLIDRLAQT